MYNFRNFLSGRGPYPFLNAFCATRDHLVPLFCKRGRLVSRYKIYRCLTIELFLHRGGNFLIGALGLGGGGGGGGGEGENSSQKLTIIYNFRIFSIQFLQVGFMSFY